MAKNNIIKRITSGQERLHINIGPVCNNNCIFCMESDREERIKVNSSLTPELVKQILTQTQSREEVCFTSGEPTLVESLPKYANLAKNLGYIRRSIMTNGRRLAYLDYCKKLIKAGINFFYISIHGHQAKLHDSLVRTKGAFGHTVLGLENLSRLKNYGIKLHTSTVITKRNLPFLGEIYHFLRNKSVDQIIFNVMQPKGRAASHFERLFPSYTNTASQMSLFLKQCQEQQPQAFLVDIPLCLTESIPDYNRGYVEKHKHFKPNESLEKPITRAQLDKLYRVKQNSCGECKYDKVCPGVWGTYIKHYGWEEFYPCR